MTTMLGNWFKTGLLMAAIMALFGVAGAAIGGGQGMLIALLFGRGTNLWAYWFSDAMVLRRYNAREVDATTAPVAGAISALAHFDMFFGHRDDGERNPLMALLVMILAPIAAVLIQLAISRGREYEADRGGAEISGDPGALTDALAK